MKYLFLSICLFVLSSVTFAQNYEIREVVELQNDLTARLKNVEDSNGNACALVRVNVPSANNIHFETSIVGEPDYLPGEYNVFIPENTKNLSFNVNENKYHIDFSKYDIIIEGKKCYRVVLTKASTNIKSTSNIVITANYDNAVVLIDGVPVGQTPLSLNNVSSGMHIVSVPNTFGVTMKDTVVNFSGDKTLSLSLHKEKKKPVYVDLATPGGDTAGWYNVFGTNVKGDEGAKGVVDYSGNMLVPYEFDYIYPGIQNGYYVVTKNHKEGLYEPGKGLIVPCIYDVIVTSMSYTHDSYMPVCIDGKWGVISPTGELVVPIEYENYPQCYKNNIKVEKKDIGYGLVSYDGHIVVSPHYSSLNSFVNGYALFRNNDNSVGFVDDNGKESIIPSGFRVGSWGVGGAIISSGLFRVKDKESGKWGYMDKQMNLVIPTIFDAENDYDDAPNFNQGIVQLKLNGDKVIINDKGKTVISKKEQGYKEMEIVCQSSLSFNKGRFFTYHETDGIINNTFIKVINEEGKCGLLSVQGKVVVPCKYSENDIQWFADDNVNYFVLRNEKSLDVINEQQKLLFSLPLSLSIEDITDGFVMIKDSDTGSFGYLNDKGEILANCIYGYESDVEETNDDNVEENLSDNSFDITEIISEMPISEGLAILSIGDRFGFIDNKGTVKVPLKYTAVTPFENGIAFVRDQNGKWTKICKKDL
jgi:hypothetical protein